MANIQFLESAKSGCQTAVEPVTIQHGPIVFNNANPGAVATEILIPVGTSAPYGGSFVNQGCEDLIVTIGYMYGSDCDSCSVDDIQVSNIDITVPADTVFDIPEGFWVSLSYVLENPATDAKVQNVSFQSFYTPDCPECLVEAVALYTGPIIDQNTDPIPCPLDFTFPGVTFDMTAYGGTATDTFASGTLLAAAVSLATGNTWQWNAGACGLSSSDSGADLPPIVAQIPINLFVVIIP